MYTFDSAVKTSRTQALLWHNTGPLPGVLSSHYLLRIVKTNATSSSNIEGFGGIPGPEAYQNKKWIRPTSTLAPYKFTSKSEVFPTWAPLPNPKIKASLSKVQALKFILQNAASKVGNCIFPNSNLQILSSKSNLRSSFANLFNFKFSKTCWKSPKLNKGILAHFEKMSLARWFWAFFFFWKKRVFCLVNWAKTNVFGDRQDEANKNAESFPTYRILAFEVW